MEARSKTPAGAPGDAVFRTPIGRVAIGTHTCVEQFRQQTAYILGHVRLRAGSIQVHQHRPQFGMFKRHRLHKSPQRRLRHRRQFSSATRLKRRHPRLPLDCLSATRHKPDAWRGLAAVRRQGLHQVQRAGCCVRHHLRKLPGVQLARRRIQPPQVDRTSQRPGPVWACQRVYKPAHLLRLHGIDCIAAVRLLPICISGIGNRDLCAGLRHLLRKSLACPAAVRQQQPVSAVRRVEVSGCPTFDRQGERMMCHDHRLVDEACTIFAWGRDNGVKAATRQQVLPLCNRQQRVARAQVSIDKAPPAIGQAEGDIHPTLRPGDFEHHQQAVWGQQAANIRQGFAQVCRRMDDIGCHDQVKLTIGQPLLRRVLLQIQHRKRSKGVAGAELFLGTRHEQRGNIRKQV